MENFTTSTFKKLDATAKTVTPLALMHQVARAKVESWSRYLRQVAGAPPNRPDHIHVCPSEKCPVMCMVTRACSSNCSVM